MLCWNAYSTNGCCKLCDVGIDYEITVNLIITYKMDVGLARAANDAAVTQLMTRVERRVLFTQFASCSGLNV